MFRTDYQKSSPLSLSAINGQPLLCLRVSESSLSEWKIPAMPKGVLLT